MLKKYLKHYQFFEHHYNINESKFAIRKNKSFRTLINVRKKIKLKNNSKQTKINNCN